MLTFKVQSLNSLSVNLNHALKTLLVKVRPNILQESGVALRGGKRHKNKRENVLLIPLAFVVKQAAFHEHFDHSRILIVVEFLQLLLKLLFLLLIDNFLLAFVHDVGEGASRGPEPLADSRNCIGSRFG